MKKEEYLEATEYQNIKEMMYDIAQKYNQKIAFTVKHKDGDKVEYEDISYMKLLEQTNYLGTKFYDLGFKDKRVAIVGRNCYFWYLAHLANLLGGIVSIPLDKELQIDELESCLIRSKADVLVFDEKYTENIEKLKSRGNVKIEKYISMNENKGYDSLNKLIEEGKSILKSGNKEYIDHEIDNNKMNILLFTSGTTSKSKAVMLSHKNVASNLYSLQLVEDVRKTDVNIALLPFHHIFGSTCMLVMLACGTKTVFSDGLRYIAQNMKEYKVSVFVGVPILLESIYKKIQEGIKKQGKTKVVAVAKKISNFLLKLHIDIRRKLFKSIIDELGGALRFVISGGAPLDKKVAQGFNELGINVVQGYGLTETSPVIASENCRKVKYGSVGFPMENVELELVNQDEQGIGEIRVKGPNVMLRLL